jgi:hypothetical protein
MKSNHLLKLALLVAGLPLAALAQTTASDVTMAQYGPHGGDKEITIGGNGSTNRALNNSAGGGTASFGYYFDNAWEGVIRQSLSYSNPQGRNGNTWNGETVGAIDFHLIQQGPVRPFVGANLGWVYGSPRNTAAAGLETGVKFYVLPRTFIFAMVDYDWFFRHDKAIASRITTGIYNWSVGMGFNF